MGLDRIVGYFDGDWLYGDNYVGMIKIYEVKLNNVGECFGKNDWICDCMGCCLKFWEGIWILNFFGFCKIFV